MITSRMMVNVAILGTCFLYTFILFIGIIIKKNKTMMAAPFITLCGFVLLQLLCGMAAWINIPDLFTLPVYKIIFILDFAMVYFLSIAWYWYLDTYIYAIKNPQVRSRRKIDIRHKSFIFIYSTIVIVIFAVLMWRDLLYRYEAQMVISYTPTYFIIAAFASIWRFVTIIIIIKNRKQIGKTHTILFLFYIILPMIGFYTDTINKFAFGYVFSAIAFFIIYVRIYNAQGEKILENLASIARKDAEMAETKMDLMMSQIQPHFLYNTLGSIVYLCKEDPDEAQATTREFSNYLRGNLQHIGSKNPIPFESELEHVKNYLSIEKRRFTDRLNVEFHMACSDFRIPALTMQTLVENAVKYSVNSKYEPTNISIETKETDKEYQVIIQDDGPGFDTNAPVKEDNRRHIGLEGAKFRLAEMVNGYLSIESEIGVGSTVTIHIPKK